uniref:Uncharacterized protein n=1 Tax=Opuntia streptacantha TaxID=393608 RepID=A0A7C8ZRD2_OPUST
MVGRRTIMGVVGMWARARLVVIGYPFGSPHRIIRMWRRRLLDDHQRRRRAMWDSHHLHNICHLRRWGSFLRLRLLRRLLLRPLRWPMRWRTTLLRWMLLIHHLINVINPQPNLPSNPTKHTLLLQWKIHQPVLPPPRKLRPVKLDPTQEIVLPGRAGRGHLLVMVHFHIELLIVHGIRVGHNKLKDLIPSRVEVPVLGGGPFSLPVKVHHHIRAGGPLPVFGKQVSSIDNLHNQLPDHPSRRLSRWRC